MSCAARYRQLAKLLEAQTGVPTGACPMSRAVTPGGRQVIERLQAAGYQAVVVGGAVRDAGRGEVAHDIDVATSATPDQVEAVFGGAVYDAGGRKHGTLLVSAPGEEPIEVTTFRYDITTDGRNATVAFTTNLPDDLQRRDLQVNALAYDPVAEKLYGPGPGGDPSDALDDLASGTVRFVGDGVERIREDRLRALRAVRFAVKLGGLHPSAEQAIRQAIDEGLLPGPLSAERVRDEMLKTLALPDGVRGMRLWQRLGLMKVFLPEMDACAGQAQNVYHGDVHVLEHNLGAAEAARPPDGVDLATMRLAMLLHDVGKPATAELKSADYGYSFIGHEEAGAAIAEDVCRRLKLDNKSRETVVLAVKEHMDVPQPDASAKSIRRWARRVGADNVEFLLAVREADWGAGGRDKTEEARRGSAQIRQVLTETETAPVAGLAVNGKEIMQALGLSRGGPEVGRAMRYLEDLVDADPTFNRKESLLASLKEWR